MAKVSIQIVTWNSMRYIFDCLESIVKQTYRDFSVMVIDNGSDDGTVDFLRVNYPTVSVLQNFKNLGYSKANNQGILLSSAEYVLVMNPDVMLTDDFLEKLVSFADAHPEAASFCGKILRAQSEAIDARDEAGLREAVVSGYFDSTGLVMYKNRRVVDRGESEKDVGQYNRAEAVFGASGACALYRRSALTDVMIKNEVFDQDFFAYKEDVDLAWRLQLYGQSAWYVPAAVCYHYRRLTGSNEHGLMRTIRHRQKASAKLRSLSFRNQHLMLIKNEFFINTILTLPHFLLWEIKLLVYSIIFERFQFGSMVSFFRLLPRMLVKRQVIMAHQKTAPRNIRAWFR